MLVGAPALAVGRQGVGGTHGWAGASDSWTTPPPASAGSESLLLATTSPLAASEHRGSAFWQQSEQRLQQQGPHPAGSAGCVGGVWSSVKKSVARGFNCSFTAKLGVAPGRGGDASGIAFVLQVRACGFARYV